ncbi:hypothetical protein ACU6U9_10195 [Pseudomonas sp. HK3]
MLVVVLLIMFITSGVIFHLKLHKYKDELKSKNGYQGIDWNGMYSDAIVQIKILKRLYKGDSDIEKELKILLSFSLTSFILLFFYMMYFLQK